MKNVKIHWNFRMKELLHAKHVFADIYFKCLTMDLSKEMNVPSQYLMM